MEMIIKKMTEKMKKTEDVGITSYQRLWLSQLEIKKENSTKLEKTLQ